MSRPNRTNRTRFELSCGQLKPGSVCLLGAFLVVLAVPAAVSAHTALDFTLPTDGATVGEPVSEITVGFTEPVILVGQGFEVFDPQGDIIVPLAVTDDDQVFRLQLDPPLGGGDVGVAYEVRSQDGHVVAGAFSFTVGVPAPTTTPATATTSIASAPTTQPESPTTTIEVIPTTGETPTTGQTTTDETPTTGGSPTTVVTTTEVVTSTTQSGDAGSDGSSSTWIFLALGGLIAIGAAAFLLFRPDSPA